MIDSINLLLGAGVSLHADMPGTWDLTDEILNKYQDWYTEMGLEFKYLPKREGFEGKVDIDVDLIGKLINDINSILRNFSKRSTDPTYEDIFEAINQIISYELNQDFNLLLYPTIEYLKNNFINVKIEKFDDCTKLIEDIIRYRLQSNGRKMKEKPIQDILKDKKYSEVNIFTLNFDTLIEELLDRQNIDFNDGFDIPVFDNQARIWNMNSFLNNNTNTINIYKLHGSLDWKKLLGSEDYFPFFKIIDMPDYPHFKSDYDTIATSSNTILLGKESKLYSYNYGIFIDLLMLFYLKLQKSNTLIISGFGFGDYGINLRIIDWMMKNQSNNIICIDPGFDWIYEKSTGTYKRLFDEWADDKRLTIIKQRFEEWNGIF